MHFQLIARYQVVIKKKKEEKRDVVHQTLERFSQVLQANSITRYSKRLKRCQDGHLWNILSHHGNLVVALGQVNHQEHCATLQEKKNPTKTGAGMIDDNVQSLVITTAVP
jgi:hypothetical protein